MHKAVVKEGLRAPLFCLGATLLVAAGGMAAAQTVEQSDLELCASLATAELKLACFEALTAIDGRGAPPAARATAEPPPESAATEKALITAGSAAVVAGSDAGRVAPVPATAADDNQMDSADDSGREQPEKEQLDIVDDPVQETPDEFQADISDDLGREHLDKEQGEEQKKAAVSATVSKVVRGGYDVLYFHFTNGQVWRQVEARRFSYPRGGEFDVSIDTGMMGDYQLRLDAGGPMTRIRRVQ